MAVVTGTGLARIESLLAEEADAFSNWPLPLYLKNFVWSLQTAGASEYLAHCTDGAPKACGPLNAFACSAIVPNASGSATARSASTLRSSSISAFLQPATNWLYDSPCCRAAALMRMIQRLRIVRFRTLRSR